MRAILYVAVLVAATPAAHADSFVDLYGGVSIPVSDDEWTDAVETSPKFGLRVGAVPNELGGYLSADWAPVNSDADGGFGGALDVSAHRFRLMVGPVFHHNVSNTLVVTGRAGIGADIQYVSTEVDVFGTRVEDSETDVGLGLEFGGGLWFKVGSVAVGGELGLPISMHDDDNENIDYNWTSIDIDLLFGVRFTSR